MLSYQRELVNKRYVYTIKFPDINLILTYDSFNIYIQTKSNEPISLIRRDFLKQAQGMRKDYEQDFKEYTVLYLFSNLYYSFIKYKNLEEYPIHLYNSTYEECLYEIIKDLTHYSEDDIEDIIQSFYGEIEYILHDKEALSISTQPQYTFEADIYKLQIVCKDANFILIDNDGMYTFDMYKADIQVIKRIAQGSTSIYATSIGTSLSNSMLTLAKQFICHLIPLIYFRTKPRL